MALDPAGPPSERDAVPEAEHVDEPAQGQSAGCALVAFVYWILSAWRPTLRLVLIVLAVGASVASAAVAWHIVTDL